MKNNLLAYPISIFFCSILYLSAAQAQDPKAARDAFEDGNYFQALKMYEQLVAKDPEVLDYRIKLGLIYLNTNIEPTLALEHLLKAESLGKMPSENLMDIAIAFSHHLQYDRMMEYLQKFEDSGKLNRKNQDLLSRLKSNARAAQDLLLYPIDIDFENLGPDVNSTYPDYHPFISKDEQLLIFTSRRKQKPGQKPEFDGYFPSDIFSAANNGVAFTNNTKLDTKVNTVYDEQCVGLSNSGDTIFFYADNIDTFGDIFMSTRVKGGYGQSVRMDASINSADVESACSVSQDGNTYLFSSNRLGGQGELDIWTISKDATGNWGAPKNLGPEVNTPLNEDFPTLSGDGLTLYFCSEGHPGMGGYDLFFSTYDTISGNWTNPQNMGYPLNTAANQKSISFSETGETAYITAFRDDGYGDLDIYRVMYNEKDESDPAIFLLSTMTPAGSTLLDKAQLQIKNQYDELIGQYYANSITNKYMVALYPGKYFVTMDVDGFAPYNEVLVVNNDHIRQDQNVKIIKLKN